MISATCRARHGEFHRTASLSGALSKNMHMLGLGELMRRHGTEIHANTNRRVALAN